MAQFPGILETGSAVLALDPRRLLLCLKTKAGPTTRHEPVARWRDLLPSLEPLQLEVEPPRVSGRGINHSAARLWVRSTRGDLDDQRIAAIRRALKRELAWVGPVYRPTASQRDEALECLFPHVLGIRPTFPNATGEFDTLTGPLERLGLTEVEDKSRYLGDLRYFVVADPAKRNAFELRDEIRKSLSDQVTDILFEHMPMMSPLAAVPDDTWFGSQWGMTQIHAPEAWDIATGASDVIIAVIDGGCDLTHEDIAYVTGRGIDLETMSGDGSPLIDTMSMRPDTHGTFVAGVAAATINNTQGIAGLAGGCRILSLASTFTDMEVAAGIRYALEEGATVINMSIYTDWSTFWTGEIPLAIEEAERRGCVLCGSAGNGNGGLGLVRPGEHPLVLACGATDMSDERWIIRRDDGTILFESSWGDSSHDSQPTGVAVMAPGERVFTTDLMGAAGATTVNYTDVFYGTSASTPFVSGLAALLQSAYPALRSSPALVRSIIARTAEKVGPLPYTDMEGWPDGTRNVEFGYGRINAFQALDLGDVMIKDWARDDGREPSTPPGGNFYSYSDIVVRSTDDDLFSPDDIALSSTAVRGQPNYVYVRVHNVGPATARDVVVDVRATPYTGLEFVYPEDWELLDSHHIRPAAVRNRFPSIAAGGPPVIAKFSLSVAEVEELWDWTERTWHPCLLAQVSASNDYAFDTTTLRGGALITRRNNLAQRNLSVMMMASGAIHSWGFLAGNAANPADRIDLVVHAGPLAGKGEVYLCIDPDPRFGGPSDRSPDDCGCDEGSTIFLDPTRIETCLNGCRGILTLAKGSRFTPVPAPPRIQAVKGGEFTDRNRTCVRIRDAISVVSLQKSPREVVPLVLSVRLPDEAPAGKRYLVDVTQRNQGRTVGGATAAFVVTA